MLTVHSSLQACLLTTWCVIVMRGQSWHKMLSSLDSSGIAILLNIPLVSSHSEEQAS